MPLKCSQRPATPAGGMTHPAIRASANAGQPHNQPVRRRNGGSSVTLDRATRSGAGQGTTRAELYGRGTVRLMAVQVLAVLGKDGFELTLNARGHPQRP